MSKNTEATSADLAADIAALRDDVAKLAESLGKAAKSRASDAGDTVAKAGGKLAETAEEAKTQLRACGAKIEAGIERHPLAAMLIAFGVGVSLAMVGRSRG
jgi:ElaB/YqjD/DUF883 family membrane-anchored ribosome-binding protein